MTIVALIVGSLIVGALARLALPGPDPMPWWATILLGFAGSLLAGIVVGVVFGAAPGFVAEVLGAIVVLYAYRRLVQKRGITGPGARRPPT